MRDYPDIKIESLFVQERYRSIRDCVGVRVCMCMYEHMRTGTSWEKSIDSRHYLARKASNEQSTSILWHHHDTARDGHD